MNTLQKSHVRHNIFSNVDHDRNHIRLQTSPPKSESTKKSSPSPQGNLVLPDINLNVKKQLAVNDLTYKMSTKSAVLTLASTMSPSGKVSSKKAFKLPLEESSIYDLPDDNDDARIGFNDDDDDNDNDVEDRSVKSNKSENSLSLDKLKHSFSQSFKNSSPLGGNGGSGGGGGPPAMSPLPLHFLENKQEELLDIQFQQRLQQLDSLEYNHHMVSVLDDDDGEGVEEGEIEENISILDHGPSHFHNGHFTSPLDAHRHFMHASHSKQHLKAIKSVTSMKSLPLNAVLNDAKKTSLMIHHPVLPAPSSPSDNIGDNQSLLDSTIASFPQLASFVQSMKSKKNKGRASPSSPPPSSPLTLPPGLGPTAADSNHDHHTENSLASHPSFLFLSSLKQAIHASHQHLKALLPANMQPTAEVDETEQAKLAAEEEATKQQQAASEKKDLLYTQQQRLLEKKHVLQIDPVHKPIKMVSFTRFGNTFDASLGDHQDNARLLLRKLDSIKLKEKQDENNAENEEMVARPSTAAFTLQSQQQYHVDDDEVGHEKGQEGEEGQEEEGHVGVEQAAAATHNNNNTIVGLARSSTNNLLSLLGLQKPDDKGQRKKQKQKKKKKQVTTTANRERSLYDIPQYQKLGRNNKKLFTSLDEYLTKVTFVAAPPKPETPRAIPPPHLNLETLFGQDGMLLKADLTVNNPGAMTVSGRKLTGRLMSDETFHRIVEQKAWEKDLLEMEVMMKRQHPIEMLEQELTKQQQQQQAKEEAERAEEAERQRQREQEEAERRRIAEQQRRNRGLTSFLPKLDFTPMKDSKTTDKNNNFSSPSLAADTTLPPISSPDGRRPSLLANYSQALSSKTNRLLTSILGRPPSGQPDQLQSPEPLAGAGGHHQPSVIYEDDEDAADLDDANNALTRPDPLRQPLHPARQGPLVYQPSTNSYIEADYINQTALGIYDRHRPGQISEYQMILNAKELEDFPEESLSKYSSSQRHQQAIYETMTGISEAVIYLPPGAHSQPQLSQLQGSPGSPGQQQSVSQGGSPAGDQASIASRSKIIRMKAKDVMMQPPMEQSTLSAFSSAGSVVSLQPGLVLSETVFQDVARKVYDLEVDNKEPTYLHYDYYNQQRKKKANQNITSEDMLDDDDGKEDEQVVVRYQNHHHKHHPHGHQYHDHGGYDDAEEDDDNSTILTKDTFQRSLPSHPPHPSHPHANQQQQKNKANKGKLSKHSDNDGQNSSSASSLRHDILQFMKKAQSPQADDYEAYIKTTSPDTAAYLASHPIHTTVAAGRPSSSNSVASGGSSASTAQQQQVRLWELMKNRYEKDKEGEHEMKIKIRTYMHEGIREDTQIMKQYMEEMEDW